MKQILEVSIGLRGEARSLDLIIHLHSDNESWFVWPSLMFCDNFDIQLHIYCTLSRGFDWAGTLIKFFWAEFGSVWNLREKVLQFVGNCSSNFCRFHTSYWSKNWRRQGKKQSVWDVWEVLNSFALWMEMYSYTDFSTFFYIYLTSVFIVRDR